MPAADLSHPDRLAATLANLNAAHAARGDGAFAEPGAGAADCRIDLKLMQHRALAAARVSDAAKAHLAAYPVERHPDLWAGTVQDGAARGLLARLEEAIALANDELANDELADDELAGGELAERRLAPSQATAFTGKDLRRKKDVLVASGGARARFTRKGGVLFVDRAHDVHSENCLWFEGRRDLGTLDAFRPDDGERARLFSAQFLKPAHYLQGKLGSELLLEGRLGRGPVGWPCRVRLQGFADEQALRVDVELPRVVVGWRLRCRLLGVPAPRWHHLCTPVREIVHDARGGFVADTLVRSCATLLVDGAPVDVPGAAQPGAVCHRFLFGDRATD